MSLERSQTRRIIRHSCLHHHQTEDQASGKICTSSPPLFIHYSLSVSVCVTPAQHWRPICSHTQSRQRRGSQGRFCFKNVNVFWNSNFKIKVVKTPLPISTWQIGRHNSGIYVTINGGKCLDPESAIRTINACVCR